MAAIQKVFKASQDPTHFDEAGSRVERNLWWLHVVYTSPLTYYSIHHNRGCKALDAKGIFQGFKGTAIHDAYRSNIQYEAVINTLYNAHQLRDLVFIQEQYQQAWDKAIDSLLLDIMESVGAA